MSDDPTDVRIDTELLARRLAEGRDDALIPLARLIAAKVHKHLERQAVGAFLLGVLFGAVSVAGGFALGCWLVQGGQFPWR